MKIRINLHFIGILVFTFTLIQFSCSSVKKSAVPCPDFSNNRNMKGHARQHGSWLVWAPQTRINGSSPALKSKNLTAAHSPVSEPVQTYSGSDGARLIPDYIPPARAHLVVMRIPIGKIQAVESAVESSDRPLTGKYTDTAERGCDTIVLKNGDIVQARVAEIGQREIRYRKCEDAEGPVIVIGISEVFMIKYPNGTRDYFNFEKSSAPAETGTVPKKTEGMAVAGFIGSLAGLFIAGIPLGIMAMVFGFVSLGKMNRHPERYKGRGFAVAGIIIGMVDIIGAIIYIANM
jgi:hypothetical protein